MEPVLYILMRTDLASMTPGKACAQSSHAANQCVERIHTKGEPRILAMLSDWQGDRGFGTCIVLGAGSGDEMTAVINAIATDDLLADVTHDPSYPLQDGAFTHHIPLDTCGWAFGSREELFPHLGHLPLAWVS